MQHIPINIHTNTHAHTDTSTLTSRLITSAFPLSSLPVAFLTIYFPALLVQENILTVCKNLSLKDNQSLLNLKAKTHFPDSTT